MSSFFLSFLVSPFPIYMVGGGVNRISLVSKPIQISPAGMVASASKSLSMGAVRMPLVLWSAVVGRPRCLIWYIPLLPWVPTGKFT